MTEKARRVLKVGGALLVGLAFVVSPWSPLVCPTRALLHIPCPSCGFTRAARCLLHLDLAGATKLQPLWWLVFPYLAAVVGFEAASYVRTGKLGQATQHAWVTRVGGVLVVALVLLWGARFLGAFGGPVSIE